MATRAQKAKVGLFMLLTLGVVASGIYFITYWGKEAEAWYYAEFDESVLGLNAGSPVVFLGVPVGIVDDIRVVPGQTEDGRNTFLSHVDILINPEKVTLRRGVTAKLSIYSLATGTLAVYLEGGDLNGQLLPPGSSIPASKSLLESVSSRVEDLLEDINLIANKLNGALEGLEPGKLTHIINEADETIGEAKELVASARQTVDSVREDTTGGLKDMRALVTDLREFTEETQKVVQQVGQKIEPVDVAATSEKLNKLLDNVNALTERLQAFSGTLDDATKSVVQDTGNIEYGLREGLRSLTQTLESLREFIEELQENPSSLVRGRGEPKEPK